MSKKQQTKTRAYQAGRSDGDVQAWLHNPKSDTDCFIRTRLQESDRKDYMQGFADGFASTKKFRGL